MKRKSGCHVEKSRRQSAARSASVTEAEMGPKPTGTGGSTTTHLAELDERKDASDGEMRECSRNPHFNIQEMSVQNDREYVLLSFPSMTSRKIISHSPSLMETCRLPSTRSSFNEIRRSQSSNNSACALQTGRTHVQHASHNTSRPTSSMALDRELNSTGCNKFSTFFRNCDDLLKKAQREGAKVIAFHQ